MNGDNIISEILNEPEVRDQSETTIEGWTDSWPDSVHHQSWHDGWRNSH